MPGRVTLFPPHLFAVTSGCSVTSSLYSIGALGSRGMYALALLTLTASAPLGCSIRVPSF